MGIINFLKLVSVVRGLGMSYRSIHAHILLMDYAIGFSDPLNSNEGGGLQREWYLCTRVSASFVIAHQCMTKLASKLSQVFKRFIQDLYSSINLDSIIILTTTKISSVDLRY